MKIWTFASLSENKNIDWNDVENNPNLFWSIDNLSRNSNINKEILFDNNLDWDIDNLSSNENIDLDFIHDNNELEWNWNKKLINSFNKNLNKDLLKHSKMKNLNLISY